MITFQNFVLIKALKSNTKIWNFSNSDNEIFEQQH